MERGQEPAESLRLGQRIVFRRTDGGEDALRLDVVQAPGRGVPPHVHPAQEERITVVEGEIDVRVGRRTMRLAAGQGVTVPPRTAHGLRVSGPRQARFENELRPALRSDDAFGQTFALERVRRPPLGRLLQLALVADEYPREFPLYVPVVPWRLQLAAMRGLARLARGVGVRSLPGDRAASADGRLLAIYLNDQLAAGVIWREVARRAARENRGTDLGEALGRVASAIAEDVETFERMMRRLQVRPSRLKPRLAVIAERLGRFKRNGRLVAYSPLSRFSELDVLAIGIEGKAILWANLRDFADVRAHLPDVDFDALIERAHAQRAELEPFRARAGRVALGRAPAR